MILKAVHFIGVLFRYVWCQVLLVISRYDKKYCSASNFRGIFSEGWYWMYHDWWACLVTGSNSTVPWPVSSSNIVAGWQNIEFDPDDLYNFQGKGCYFQGQSKITIGKGTYIANNVGIITANHDIADPSRHMVAEHVKIGEHCWIGMNAMILPGVELGPHTTVGGGAIVTRSFPDGYCVIAGNPARVIKTIPNC